MRDQLPWVQALKIAANVFEEWKTIAPKDESFTFWCLQTGRINPIDYFNWAREHYKIVELAPEYFDLTPNRNLWKQIQSVANWSASLLPLEQWDGVLFIGCVEPAMETKWSFPVRYVLVEPNMLIHRWRELNTSADVEVTSTPPPVAQTNSQSTRPPLITLEDAPAPVSNDDAPLTASNLEMPAGLSLDVSKMVDAPAGITLTGIEVPKLDLSVLNLHPEKPKAPAAPPAAAPPARASASVPSTIGTTGGIENIDQAKTVDECLAWCFRQLKARFTLTIAFTYKASGLEAWRWDESVAPADSSAITIAFDTPSLFRVTARTLRPYHGFVVDNPTHRAFFKNWKMTDLPKHVTAIPVRSGNNFQGLFLCIHRDQSKALDTLEFAEMIVDKTVVQLAKIGSPFHSKAA